jgi:hypothetical protein
MRFEERYRASVEKQLRRREDGKPEHQTVLRSMNENKERLETTPILRRILLEKTNKSNANKKKGRKPNWV